MTLEPKIERERIHVAKFGMTANYKPTSEAPRQRETVLGTEAVNPLPTTAFTVGCGSHH